ncbi:hypothetical protein HAX54_036357 [Datura stramonium]|uniref:Uncharacterized protein n=1 Tax=Datura stramonium TaxID=4076 RepID=A0ABS8VJI3_DATST|nr:hypothetical protein [Datura stramonium]
MSQDEPSDSEEEVHEIGAKGPTPAYQTTSISRQQVTTPKSNERDNSSENRSSLDGPEFDRRKRVAMRPQEIRQRKLNHLEEMSSKLKHQDFEKVCAGKSRVQKNIFRRTSPPQEEEISRGASLRK